MFKNDGKFSVFIQSEHCKANPVHTSNNTEFHTYSSSCCCWLFEQKVRIARRLKSCLNKIIMGLTIFGLTAPRVASRTLLVPSSCDSEYILMGHCCCALKIFNLSPAEWTLDGQSEQLWKTLKFKP